MTCAGVRGRAKSPELPRSSEWKAGLVLAAFGVGLANFGTGRGVLPRHLAADVSEVLPLIGWYGATGNFAIADDDPETVRAVLQKISGTTWALMPFDEINAALDILAALAEPPHSVDERPTPGLAFAVTRANPGAVESTPRADLRRISDRVVAVRKLDVVKNGKLDREQRRGGWGGVSIDIARQVGGQWTARSRRTLDGLRLRANEGPESLTSAR